MNRCGQGVAVVLAAISSVVPIERVRADVTAESVFGDARRYTGFRPSVVQRQGIVVDGALIAAIALEDSALADPARLFVQSVEPGSAAAARGFDKLDIVDTIDGRRFEDLKSLVSYLDGRDPKKPIRMVLRRWSESSTRWIEFHTRELPGEEIQQVGPEVHLVSEGR